VRSIKDGGSQDRCPAFSIGGSGLTVRNRNPCIHAILPMFRITGQIGSISACQLGRVHHLGVPAKRLTSPDWLGTSAMCASSQER
jgi:hypothetical protein